MGEFFAAAAEVYTFGYGEMFLYPELAPLITVLKGPRLPDVRGHQRAAHPAGGRRLARRDGLRPPRVLDRRRRPRRRWRSLRGASLAKILRTLQPGSTKKRQRRKSVFPRIVVNFVAQSDNYAELPELARLLAPLGIYFLGVNPLHHFSGTGSAYHDYYAA